tara:strand:- start:604 stop:1260 length:657 start_codon:yes stop_codon:yes gene_type:complete
MVDSLESLINNPNKGYKTMLPKLSKASKMNCKSFSLPVNLEVCKGMLDATGKVKPVCQSCYAKKGFYHMPVVKAVRENNLIASKEIDFPKHMIKLLEKQKYFRWFDSGDIYSSRFLLFIYKICKLTPNTRHWIPTKSRELFDNITWKLLEALPNVTVRYSSPSIIGTYEEKHGSTVSSVIKKSTKDLFYCPASKQKGKCNDCRACWNKNLKVVSYLKH